MTIKNFIGLIDRQAVLITLLAIISTVACRWMGLAAEVPMDLLGIAVVFPIVFSISAAYRRREEALESLAALKADTLALFLAHRDWVPGGGGEHAWRARRLVHDVLHAILDYLAGPREEREGALSRFYQGISALSRSIEAIRAAGVPPNEISRVNQYLRYTMAHFEKLRNIRIYRTPKSLRAYSAVFLDAFPILFGPAFAHLGDKYYPAVGYGVAVLYAVVLGTLNNVQEQLEDPFDNMGIDDIRLDILAESEQTMALDEVETPPVLV